MGNRIKIEETEVMNKGRSTDEEDEKGHKR